MLPKINRLTRLEVEQIKRSHTVPLSGQYFGLVKLSKVGKPKFAVIISNKIAKSAVVRNHIRRVVYSAIHPIIDQQHGWRLFLAKKSVVEADRKRILEDIQKLLGFQKTLPCRQAGLKTQ